MNEFSKQINSKYKFIAKPNTWYKANTEVLVDDCLYDFDNIKDFNEYFNNNGNFSNMGGLFVGLLEETQEHLDCCFGSPYKVGDIHIDGEGCVLHEFEISLREEKIDINKDIVELVLLLNKHIKITKFDDK